MTRSGMLTTKLESARRERNLQHDKREFALMTQINSHVEINPELLAEAERMDIDAVAVAERALIREIKAKQSPASDDTGARKWQEENAEALEWSNRRFEEYGFPFPQYRRY
jgi:post-segregation antitoxin (ccd killing protein)